MCLFSYKYQVISWAHELANSCASPHGDKPLDKQGKSIGQLCCITQPDGRVSWGSTVSLCRGWWPCGLLPLAVGSATAGGPARLCLPESARTDFEWAERWRRRGMSGPVGCMMICRLRTPSYSPAERLHLFHHPAAGNILTSRFRFQDTTDDSVVVATGSFFFCGSVTKQRCWQSWRSILEI